MCHGGGMWDMPTCVIRLDPITSLHVHLVLIFENNFFFFLDSLAQWTWPICRCGSWTVQSKLARCVLWRCQDMCLSTIRMTRMWNPLTCEWTVLVIQVYRLQRCVCDWMRWMLSRGEATEFPMVLFSNFVEIRESHILSRKTKQNKNKQKYMLSVETASDALRYA